MLKLQRKDKQAEPIWVAEALFSIGSASDNNLILNEPGIDPLHARLVCTDGSVTLKDNTSSSGCFVNGQRVTQKLLEPGDLLKLGALEFAVLDPQTTDPEAPPDTQWRLVADGSWLRGQAFAIPQGQRCVIGRSNECDIQISGSHLSRRHVELSVMGSSLHVRDLGSANGTYLNDKPVTDGLAHSGDQLRLDVYTFRVVSPDSDLNKTRVRATPTPKYTRTVERKPPSHEPKRWKTKPTSPGNRSEPTYPEPRPAWPWVVAGLAVLALGALLWWL